MSNIFDNMFKKKDNEDKKQNNFNKYKSNNFKKNTKEKKINLFKETPDKKEIDVESVTFVNDVAILMYENKDLEENVETIFNKLFKLLDEKKYNVRLLCKNSEKLLPIIKDNYNVKRVNMVKPWENFCSIKDFRTWIPSNINIQNAANYVNNFDKLSTGLKYIKSAYLTLLTSYTGKHMVKYVLVYDPHYTGKDKLDYKKSKDTYDMYKLLNNIETVPVYNLANTNDLKTFVDLISK